MESIIDSKHYYTLHHTAVATIFLYIQWQMPVRKLHIEDTSLSNGRKQYMSKKTGNSVDSSILEFDVRSVKCRGITSGNNLLSSFPVDFKVPHMSLSKIVKLSQTS
jgi:hypothetical protein